MLLKKQFDKLAMQVIKNTEEIKEKMVTKGEFNQFKQEMLTGQDKVMNILERLDQKRIFTHDWVRRIEEDVNKNKGEIKRIKKQLAID